MRFYNRYKLCSNVDISTIRLSKRLLDFKRPKWMRIKKKLSLLELKVQNTIQARLNSKSLFAMSEEKDKKRTNINKSTKEEKRISFSYFDLNKKGVSTSFRGIPAVGRFYKTKLKAKKYIQSAFDNSLNFERETFSGEKIEYLAKSLVKPFYRIDILLWYFNYFSTTYQAIHQIRNDIVLVNEKSVCSNFYVAKGDIITFSDKGLLKIKDTILKNKDKYWINNLYFTFLEIDYYSNTIVVIKDFDELSSDDLTLLIEKPLYYQNLLKK